MVIINLRLIAILTIFSIASCRDGVKSTNTLVEKNTANQIQLIDITSPFNGDVFNLGDSLTISLKPKNDTIRVDSVKLRINGSPIGTLQGSNIKHNWDSKTSKLGRVIIEAEAFGANKLSYKTLVNIALKTNNKPKNYTYKIIKTYPHSRDAYTQGLIYENGIFYESDGLYGKSVLRKIKPGTGEALNYAILATNIFAEGIAVYGEKIYQLSWREKTCFVYDKNTFTLERQFQYDIEEGWGLTYDGKNFLMTDGSNIVYTIDPQSFTEIKRIEVMDNNGPVNNLNELEYSNGKLYANVYQTDFVVIINPNTGEVIGKIDFKGLLLKIDYRDNTDVLNGIAFNPSNGHFFVTGKNWPKLFEVSINELNK